MIWLLIGYMWLFIHRPFEIWPWLATLRIERVYMLGTIICWFASGMSLPSGNRLNRYFALFVVVMLFSWIVSPFQSVGDETVENYLKYGVFYVLLVTSVRTGQDLKKIIIGHFCIMTLMMVHILREYFSGNSWFAQGIVRMQGLGSTFKDPNDIAGLFVCSLPFAWALWLEWHRWWQHMMILGHCALAGYCIVLTGSRMGFIGFVLAVILACMASRKRWRLLTLGAALLACVWFILPEDRKDRYFTLVDSSSSRSDSANSAGRLRYAGFEKSIPLFIERPLFGFGPKGFGVATGTGMMPHNLYGQLLAELGVSGAVAFAMILWGVAQNTLEARRYVRAMGLVDNLAWRTVSAAAASFLLLAIMAWGFNFLFWHVWLWFGAFQVAALKCLSQQSETIQWGESFDSAPIIGKPWNIVYLRSARL